MENQEIKQQKIGFIYKITNTYNGKIYIGQTIHSIEKRFNRHFYESCIKNTKTKFSNAIKKYGKNGFSVEKIYECPQEELNKWEIYYIEYYNSFNNGNNSTTGGSGISNCIVSEETRKKISDLQIEYNKREDVKKFKSMCLLQEKHHQFNKLGEKNKNYGLIRKITQENINMVNEIRQLKFDGKTTEELSQKYKRSIKTINNYCGPDFEHYGTPTTTNCSIKRQSFFRTKKVLESRKLKQETQSQQSETQSQQSETQSPLHVD